MFISQNPIGSPLEALRASLGISKTYSVGSGHCEYPTLPASGQSPEKQDYTDKKPDKGIGTLKNEVLRCNGVLQWRDVRFKQ